MTRRSLWLVPCALSSLIAFASLEGCDRVVEATGPNGQTGDALQGQACSNEGEAVACAGQAETTCAKGTSGHLVWSTCEGSTCTEGQTRDCSMDAGGPNMNSASQSCVKDQTTGDWVWGECTPISSGSTPLVFSFDDAPVRFSHAEGSFGVEPMKSVDTDWPSAATPWLALDKNGNGRIDDGGELFGSATLLSDGTYAKNGFQALAELDENHDGVISAADRAFDSLVVWSDTNQNRVADPGEVRSLRSMGIEAIELDYGKSPRCDARHNCEIESARFVYRGIFGEEKVGHVVDVHLAHQ